MSYLEVDNSFTKLKLSDITLDNEIQPRQQLNQEVVTKYAEAMRQGTKFPPVVVFFDGDSYWLADGFHRFLAKQVIAEQKISTEVRPGSRYDAKLYSTSAKMTPSDVHSSEEKHRFFENILYDGESEPLQFLDQSPNRSRRKRGQTIATNCSETLTNIS
ncbi:ParB N-terminal domain-containing protein [Acaryochloris marina]|uniref:ParB N-terminal domain-containing protein n=1 Tax=Acaryochloris marina TaxID=155978 RepID=UPI001BAEE901|nr:ParB N-terminal domain-containing protein [Acaryochloris marina]QUY40302.1 ParB N-terminal domain-containing protein [Acaryochloris marina S15]